MAPVTLANYASFESFESKKLDVFIQLGKDLEEDVLAQMLATYFQTTEETLGHFKDHLSNKDFKMVAHLAHKLKSSSGQLGLHRLHKLCTDLENFVHDEASTNVEITVAQYLQLITSETHLTTALLSDFLKAA